MIGRTYGHYFKDFKFDMSTKERYGVIAKTTHGVKERSSVYMTGLFTSDNRSFNIGEADDI